MKIKNLLIPTICIASLAPATALVGCGNQAITIENKSISASKTTGLETFNADVIVDIKVNDWPGYWTGTSLEAVKANDGNWRIEVTKNLEVENHIGIYFGNATIDNLPTKEKPNQFEKDFGFILRCTTQEGPIERTYMFHSNISWYAKGTAEDVNPVFKEFSIKLTSEK